MLIIHANTSIVKVNFANNKNICARNLQENREKVSFKGTIIRPVKNETEIKELVNLFYDAIKHNFAPNKKTFFLLEKFD